MKVCFIVVENSCKAIKNYESHVFENKKYFPNQIKNDEYLRDIVNRNIGYADGVGVVMALEKNGLDAVKIPEGGGRVFVRYYKRI